jgi:hypothetical protein
MSAIRKACSISEDLDIRLLAYNKDHPYLTLNLSGILQDALDKRLKTEGY